MLNIITVFVSFHVFEYYSLKHGGINEHNYIINKLYMYVKFIHIFIQKSC